MIPIDMMQTLKQSFEDVYLLIGEVNNLYNNRISDEHDFYEEGKYFPIPNEFDIGEIEPHTVCFNMYLNTLTRYVETWSEFYDSEDFDIFKNNVVKKIQRWYKQCKYRKKTMKKVVAFNKLNKFSNLNLDTIQTILLKV